MTMITRRSILAGLAAAATTATAVGAASGPQENPDLLALADKLDGLTADYIAARDEVEWIIAEWSHQWPTPDPAIACYGNGCKIHSGLDGRGIETQWGRSGPMRVQDLGTPETLSAQVAHYEAIAERKSKTKSQRGMRQALMWAEKERAAIEPARAYWSEVEQITQASGIKHAQANRDHLLEVLHGHIDAIMTTPETTIAGAVIKAQALAAWSNADTFRKAFNMQGVGWGEEMAAAIMRQAGAAS